MIYQTHGVSKMPISSLIEILRVKTFSSSLWCNYKDLSSSVFFRCPKRSYKENWGTGVMVVQSILQKFSAFRYKKLRLKLVYVHLKSCTFKFSLQLEGLFEGAPASREERNWRSVLLAGAILLSPSDWNKKLEAQDSRNKLILT